MKDYSINDGMKKAWKGEFHQIYEAVWMWFNQARKSKIIVTEEILTIKALELKKVFFSHIEDDNKKERLILFKASGGWVRNFWERYGIQKKVLYGESGLVTLDKINEERERLRNITKQFSAENVFNADETELFYRMMPNRTLAAKN